MQAKEKDKEVEELNRAVERVTTFKRVFDNHPLIKKYWGFTGLALGFVIIVLFFNNSMIGIGSVETKDYQVSHLDGIGGSVETKTTKGDMSSGIGSDKTNSRSSTVSKEDAYVMDGKVEAIHVYNMTMNQGQVQSIYHTDEASGVKDHYDTSDINTAVVGTFGAALNATESWISLLVVLGVTGFTLAIVIGILFEISRIFGLG